LEDGLQKVKISDKAYPIDDLRDSNTHKAKKNFKKAQKESWKKIRYEKCLQHTASPRKSKT
jgi:hypothetical protein